MLVPVPVLVLVLDHDCDSVPEACSSRCRETAQGRPRRAFAGAAVVARDHEPQPPTLEHARGLPARRHGEGDGRHRGVLGCSKQGGLDLKNKTHPRFR